MVSACEPVVRSADFSAVIRTFDCAMLLTPTVDTCCVAPAECSDRYSSSGSLWLDRRCANQPAIDDTYDYATPSDSTVDRSA